MTARTKTEAACLAAAMSDLEYIGAVTGRDPIKRIRFVEERPYRLAGLDAQIAQARREMGEAKWQQLNKEWEA